MSEPIIVTKEAIKEWVMKQPDDREVVMTNPYYNDDCGCLMVQYGKDVLKQEFRNVGFTSWWQGEFGSKTAPTNEIATLDPSIGGIIYLLGNPDLHYYDWADATTFGDLKKQLSR